MRRAEEIEVLQRLLRIGNLVAARNAERVVKLEAAFPATLEIDAAIFPRKRKVTVVRRAGTDGGVNFLAEAFLGFAAGDHDLPGLAVAPRGGALCRLQDPLNGRAWHGVRVKRAAGITFTEQFFENLDR